MQAKRFFYACAGLLCLALAYQLGASSVAARSTSNSRTSFETVVARRLVIADEQGKPRIDLEMLSGSPVVEMNDEQGKVRLTLFVGNTGISGLDLSAPDGTTTASLTTLGDGQSLLDLHGGEGNASASLSAVPDGGSLTVDDDAGTVRAAVAVGNDKQHESVAKMKLLDKNSKTVWEAPR